MPICDCCGRPIPESAMERRVRHPYEPSYIVTLNGHERHWYTEKP